MHGRRPAVRSSTARSTTAPRSPQSSTRSPSMSAPSAANWRELPSSTSALRSASSAARPNHWPPSSPTMAIGSVLTPRTYALATSSRTDASSAAGRRPGRVAAERDEQPVLRIVGVPGAGGALADHAAAPVLVLAVGEPRRQGVDELGVDAAVGAGRGREVPPVDDVVGGELVGVLVGRGVAERKVGHDAGDDAAGGGGLGGVAGGSGAGERIVAQQVALEPVADVLDGRPVHHRHGPQVLVHEVVHEGAHVPVRAGRRPRPDVVRVSFEGVEPGDEALDAPPVQVGHVHGRRPPRVTPAAPGGTRPSLAEGSSWVTRTRTTTPTPTASLPAPPGRGSAPGPVTRVGCWWPS